jgi:hypothetical protein
MCRIYGCKIFLSLFTHSLTHISLFLTQPERINLQPTQKGYDVRADIWSLGISLVELANGTSPYTEQKFSNEFQLLTHIVNAPPPLPDEEHFSPLFCDFISKWWVVKNVSLLSLSQHTHDPNYLCTCTLYLNLPLHINVFLSLPPSLPPSPSPSLPPSLSLSLPSLSSLSKEVVVRPYYHDLLEHPLIKEYESKDVDVGEWFRDVNKTIGPV